MPPHVPQSLEFVCLSIMFCNVIQAHVMHCSNSQALQKVSSLEEYGKCLFAVWSLSLKSLHVELMNDHWLTLVNASITEWQCKTHTLCLLWVTVWCSEPCLCWVLSLFWWFLSRSVHFHLFLHRSRKNRPGGDGTEASTIQEKCFAPRFIQVPQDLSVEEGRFCRIDFKVIKHPACICFTYYSNASGLIKIKY